MFSLRGFVDICLSRKPLVSLAEPARSAFAPPYGHCLAQLPPTGSWSNDAFLDRISGALLVVLCVRLGVVAGFVIQSSDVLDSVLATAGEDWPCLHKPASQSRIYRDPTFSC